MEREFISSKQQTPKNRSVTVYNSNRCFQNRLGSSLSGKQHGETWSYQERTKHINVLELIAVKLAILTFTKEKSVITIHLELDNTKALLYLVKMGGNSQSRAATSSQGNMGLSVSQSNSSYNITYQAV